MSRLDTVLDIFGLCLRLVIRGMHATLPAGPESLVPASFAVRAVIPGRSSRLIFPIRGESSTSYTSIRLVSLVV